MQRDSSTIDPTPSATTAVVRQAPAISIEPRIFTRLGRGRRAASDTTTTNHNDFADVLMMFANLDDDISDMHYVMIASSLSEDPLSYSAAINSPIANDWIAAMDCELSSLDISGRWEEVVVPEGANVAANGSTRQNEMAWARLSNTRLGLLPKGNRKFKGSTSTRRSHRLQD